MSAPAAKALPAPVRMAQSTGSALDARPVKAWPSSATTRALRALSLSGRLMVTVATAPVRSMVTSSSFSFSMRSALARAPAGGKRARSALALAEDRRQIRRQRRVHREGRHGGVALPHQVVRVQRMAGALALAGGSRGSGGLPRRGRAAGARRRACRRRAGGRWRRSGRGSGGARPWGPSPRRGPRGRARGASGSWSTRGGARGGPRRGGGCRGRRGGDPWGGARAGSRWCRTRGGRPRRRSPGSACRAGLPSGRQRARRRPRPCGPRARCRWCRCRGGARGRARAASSRCRPSPGSGRRARWRGCRIVRN